MRAVWSADAPLTARQVADSLADRGLAYTTWLTVLNRLVGKGLLVRDAAERAHTYAAAATRDDHTAVLMREALGQADDRQAALARFAEAITPAEAAALRRVLADLG